MYELIPVSRQTYYIDCPAKIGIYLSNDTDAYLIDSGNDKETGKKVQKILAAQGWTLKTILNTHSNADHIGGNHLLQERLGCPVYAKGIESTFTQFPLLEPSFLYGGFPPKALRNKFLMAQDSRAMDISHAVLPDGVEVLDLPGHFFHMIGFKTPDDVYFMADCVFSESTLEKYHISFIYDIAAYLDTLAYVEGLSGRLFVPAHAEPCSDMRQLVAANRKKVHEIKERLLDICKVPLPFEEILKLIFDGYALQLDFNQYCLVGSTIRSYLSWLSDLGLMTSRFEDNRLLWFAAAG